MARPDEAVPAEEEELLPTAIGELVPDGENAVVAVRGATLVKDASVETRAAIVVTVLLSAEVVDVIEVINVVDGVVAA